jgi:hypothetical protein
MHPGGRHLVWVSVATTERAAKATPVSYSDWKVISRPAEKHGAETRPVVGLQTPDGAGAEQAPQLDSGYDPVRWSPSGWIGGVHYDPIERRSDPSMPSATR